MRLGYISAGTNIDSSTVPQTLYEGSWNTQRADSSLQTNAIPTINTGNQSELFISEINIFRPELIPGNIFAYALRRDDSSNDDSYTGNIKIAYIEAEALFWRF